MFAGIDLRDIAVVVSCVFVFVVTITLTADKAHRHLLAGQLPPNGPHIAKIAEDLGVTPYRLRNAFEEVGPPSRTPLQPPSEQQLAEHSRRLAVALDLPVTQVRTVLAAYKPSMR